MSHNQIQWPGKDHNKKGREGGRRHIQVENHAHSLSGKQKKKSKKNGNSRRQ